MRHLLRWIVLIAIVGTTSVACARAEEMTVRIVAYDADLLCLNGNVGWRVIFRAQASKHATPKYVLMYFTEPCGFTPDSLIANSNVRRFRLIRGKGIDSALNEYIECYLDTPKGSPPQLCPPDWERLLAWKRTPGAEHEPLPFGSVLPGYRSPDLPYVPLL